MKLRKIYSAAELLEPSNLGLGESAQKLMAGIQRPWVQFLVLHDTQPLLTHSPRLVSHAYPKTSLMKVAP